MKTTVGIDIGGTNTAIGIVNSKGEVICKTSIPTSSHGDIERFADEIKEAIATLVAEAGGVAIDGIGIGAPDANYYTGTIDNAPNLSFPGVIPFVDIIKSRFPEVATVVMTNDANAATLGEMVYGGAVGMKDIAMYTLGTGVGFGLVANGKLVYGHDGFAGECGHNVLFEDGRDCDCGMKGCLEAYCSAGGMKRTAFELMAQYHEPNSPLTKVAYDDLTSKLIYDAAMAGDHLANEVFRLTGKYMAKAISFTIHHTSPEAVFLFGGPVAAGRLIVDPIVKYMNDYLFETFKSKVKVMPSQLASGNAAIVGASALVMSEMD